MTELLDALHDGIDVSEEHRAKARDAVRAIWIRDMPAIIQEAAREQEKGGAPHAALMQAIEAYVGLVAQHMRQLANDSAMAGYRAGIKQRKASE